MVRLTLERHRSVLRVQVLGGLLSGLVSLAGCSKTGVPTEQGRGGAEGTPGTGGRSVVTSGGAGVPAAGGRGGNGTIAGTGGTTISDAGNGSVGGGDPGAGGQGATTTTDGGANDRPVVAPPTDAGPGTLGGGPVTTSATHLDIGVHDPAMIWDGQRYYLLATGSGSSLRTSTNMMQWTNAGRFLPGLPAWVAPAIGTAPDGNTPWAPDISYFNGVFHVYYTASVFGRNTSAIGVATNTTLDPTAAGYAWVDKGMVIQSKSTDDFNAIDPNVAFDADGVPWLAFGSFWSGIKMRKLDPATGTLSPDDPMLYSLASRGGGAIEAPSIISHGGYYYLFVSFDKCCDRLNSTYRTMVGRATAITGPYVDSTGKAMMQSGGDQLLAASGRYIGPGGGTAWKNGDNYLYVHHYYDGMANGASKLQIRPINFTADGWVTLAEPLFP